MKDKIRIELSSENRLGWEPFYAVLDLPATAQQIRDAKQKARITGREDTTYQSIRLIDFEPLPNLKHTRLNTTSVEELNYLAQRLDSLSEEQFTIYRALFIRQFGNVESNELPSVKDLINMTYDLDGVMIASNIRNDEQLGQFVIENDLHPDVAVIPESSLYLLDKHRIGELQRQSDDGVFMDGFYVVTGDYEIPEVYDGKNVPSAEKGVFRLKIGIANIKNPESAEANAVRITLPIPRSEADAIVSDAFGVESVEDCSCLDIESGIPQISAVDFKGMVDFDALNFIAKQYLAMAEAGQIKFKAILQAENICGVDGIMAVADRLNDYELSYFDGDAASFFKSHICHNLDVRFDDHWLDRLLTQNEGEKLIERLGVSITDYGILSARGGHLFEPVPVEPPEAKDLKTHGNFGGTWRSDYVPTRLGGLIARDQPKENTQKPDCQLIGQDGNIFNLMGIAARTLRQNGLADQAKEMCNRIHESGNYYKELGIIGEYVNITSVDDAPNEAEDVEEGMVLS